MAKINPNYKKLPQTYLFSEVTKRTKKFLESNPGVEILKLGIGNTTQPLAPVLVKGLMEGVKKLSNAKTYTGYGDEQGDIRLRKEIVKWYKKRGILIESEEVFISDGAKPDAANISSIFDQKSIVAICDPVYPVYLDSNIIGGRKAIFLKGEEKNNFFPKPPKIKVDLIFLCSPSNPTGTVATKNQLQEFVVYALKNKATIVFDAAYSEYISEKGLPKSIYEIEEAKKCAIEIQSFSKSAGFTGVRLGWSVVPKGLKIEDDGDLNKLWNRRQTTMFNGASNIAQMGGLAYFSKEGQEQTKKQINYYLENAKIIKKGMESLGLKVFGGENAPYVWVCCPKGLSSWEFFDKLLNECGVVSTPGSGFGSMGEGYLRLSAFGSKENIKKGVELIKKNLKI